MGKKILFYDNSCMSKIIRVGKFDRAIVFYLRTLRMKVREV